MQDYLRHACFPQAILVQVAVQPHTFVPLEGTPDREQGSLA